MDELIKREDAIEAMAELQGIAQSKAELTGISKAWKRIKVLPTVDAVPVVRCGECKYLTEITDYNGWCPRINDHIENFDWFCAGGERKEKDDATN